ncbi:MAG: InlB B-repeat-containing protein [Saccharofermentanales bacterium]
MNRFLKKVMSVLVAAILVIGAGFLPDFEHGGHAGVSAEVLSDPYFAGEGTELSPFLISSAAHMVQLSALVNASDIAYIDKYYKMLNDIDMTGITDWMPIGFSGMVSFEGTFDGGEYSIMNLVVEREAVTNEYAYLLGVFGSNKGTIMNLSVADCSFYLYGNCRIFIGGITGVNSGLILNSASSCYIGSPNIATLGGIAGSNFGGEIRQSYNGGDLEGSESSIGGIAGSNMTGSSIYDSMNGGSITGNYSDIGGIAGSNEFDSVISGCYNIGTVWGTGSDIGGIAGINNTAITSSANSGYIYGYDSRVGGIAGLTGNASIFDSYNIGYVDVYWENGTAIAGGITGGAEYNAQIARCYNTGYIYGENADKLGGIAGYIAYATVSDTYNGGIVYNDSVYSDGYTGGISGSNGSGTIQRCYNVGPIYGNEFTGGFSGSNVNGSYDSCYYLDGNELGVATGPGSPAARTLLQLQNIATFSGFDFSAVWIMQPGDQYPQLRQALREQVFVSYTETDGTVYFVDVTFPGDMAYEIEPPTKEGATFLGWYKDIACTQLFTFDTPVTSDITLYIKWSVAAFTVTFDKNGGTTEANPRIRTVNANTATALPTTNPTRAGYTFAGWNTTANGSGMAFTSSTIVTADMTVYAQWVQIPVGLQAAVDTGTSLKITWTAAAGVTGYEVYRSTSSTGSYTLAGTVTAPAISFTNTGLTAGTTYYYKIRAYRIAGGVKLYSAYTSVVSCKVIPPTVTGLKAVSTSYSSIKLTWTAAAGATGYQIYRAATSTGAYALVATVTVNTYTNTGLATGSTYYYKVMSYKTVGTSMVKAAAYSAVVSCKVTPLAVSGLKAVSATYNSIKLTWTAVSGATGYQVYRAASASGTYSLISTVTTAYYTNTALATGTTYYYKVMSYRTVGTTPVKATAYSAVVSCKVTPPVVGGLKAASSSYNSIKLTWTAASGASGYLVYRAASTSGTYALVGTVSTAYFTNTALATGTTYYYKVISYRTVGTTKVTAAAYSTVVYAKPIPATISVLTVVKVTTTSKKISWGAIAGASGYEVYRATSSTGTYTLVTSTAALAYTNTGLISGKIYFYKVRAYRTVGTTKVYGAYSVVKSA